MNRPYVTLKFAQTLDGKIAAEDGSSRWISCPESLKFTHKLRAKSDGILVGIRTILKDNPSLTTRLVKGKNPIRIVLDSRLRIPFASRVIKGGQGREKIIITTPKAAKRKIEKLEALGVEILVIPSSRGGDIDLRKILRILYKKGIKNLLVEGGERVITSFIKAGLADRIAVIISPKILGNGIESVGNLDIGNIKDALKLRLKDTKRLGSDIIYTASFRHD